MQMQAVVMSMPAAGEGFGPVKDHGRDAFGLETGGSSQPGRACPDDHRFHGYPPVRLRSAWHRRAGPVNGVSGRCAKDAGDLEFHVLDGGFHLFDGHVVTGAEGVDHFFYKNFWGRGPGGDADGPDPL